MPTTLSGPAGVRLRTPAVEDIARALTSAVSEMWQRDYLQEWHGFDCVDSGRVEGRAAMPLADHIEAETGWRSAWPLREPLIDLPDDVQVSGTEWEDRLLRSEEDRLFDLIEYFHRHVFQGIGDEHGNHFHDHNGCGWHYQVFDQAPAYVPGLSLHEAVTGYGPMPPRTVLLLIAGVAEALQAIHAACVVHRD